jgi:hypothetical protein
MIENHLEIIQKETEKEKQNKNTRMTAEEQKKYFLSLKMQNLIAETNDANNNKKFNSKNTKDEYYYDPKTKKHVKRSEIEIYDKAIDNLNKDKNLDYKNFTKSHTEKTLTQDFINNPDKKSADIVRNHDLRKQKLKESKIIK